MATCRNRMRYSQEITLQPAIGKIFVQTKSNGHAIISALRRQTSQARQVKAP
ncbi:hypothetical protein CKO_05088 [Citrobacter koseri ATCC BAA-895]|uniref:Uncharacterized protein n=1 Tax=Citrobacter koseri (strain ATCC BAA-895 / CDC 4225-83 / SGSC4696) TaxID=290338 RepID=A8ARL9_CITK8|nr:hypothetical protein CKO_05088 [Citrobacter koseri ATCC BAA-895]